MEDTISLGLVVSELLSILSSMYLRRNPESSI